MRSILTFTWTSAVCLYDTEAHCMKEQGTHIPVTLWKAHSSMIAG